jgi:hypothetical protein
MGTRSHHTDPNYYKRYHPNRGTKYVFDSFYNILAHIYKIQGSLMATPGTDLNRYITYAQMLCSHLSKAFFLENNEERFLNLRNQLHKRTDVPKNKVMVLKANAFSYTDSQFYTLARPCRIEDLGIGFGVAEMIYRCIGRLYDQRSRCNKNNNFKAQIINSAAQHYKKERIIELYQQYLGVLNLRIKYINGFDASTPEGMHLDNAKEILTYKGGSVREYDIELFENKKDAKLYMYSYTQGSLMLPSMIVYR